MAIDDAIAAVERPAAEQRANLKVQLRSGRFAMLNLPADLTAEEAIDFIGFVATALPAELAKVRRPMSRLAVVRGQLPRA